MNFLEEHLALVVAAAAAHPGEVIAPLGVDAGFVHLSTAFTQDPTPCSWPLDTTGPPESPGHESLPASRTPAQNVLLLM